MASVIRSHWAGQYHVEILDDNSIISFRKELQSLPKMLDLFAFRHCSNHIVFTLWRFDLRPSYNISYILVNRAVAFPIVPPL